MRKNKKLTVNMLPEKHISWWGDKDIEKIIKDEIEMFPGQQLNNSNPIVLFFNEIFSHSRVVVKKLNEAEIKYTTSIDENGFNLVFKNKAGLTYYYLINSKDE